MNLLLILYLPSPSSLINSIPALCVMGGSGGGPVRCPHHIPTLIDYFCFATLGFAFKGNLSQSQMSCMDFLLASLMLVMELQTS